MTDAVPEAANEPLHYTACGLDNIYLASGFTRKVVGGETYVSVNDAEDLHEAIAMTLARKKLLSGSEIRFLRKYLEYTQSDLGDWLGVSDQSIARYEKDRGTMDPSADAILRLLVIGKISKSVNVHEELAKLRLQDDVPSDCLMMELEHDEWRAVAA